MPRIKFEFHLCEGVGLPTVARFSGKPGSEGVAAPFTVKTSRPDFIGEEHVEERVLFGGIRKTAADSETETGLIATEVVYCNGKVSIRRRKCYELIKFVLHTPVSVDLCMQAAILYFPY